MFFELREYRTKSGQRNNWVSFMEEKIIPFQVSKGMIIVGSFVGLDNPDLYIWIRRFDSQDELERQYHAVYESDYWKKTIEPEIPKMLDMSHAVVTKITPTPKSPMRGLR